MPNPYFFSFEIVVIASFLLCLRHAWRAGGAAVWSLVAGVLFGVLLELATIRQLHAYRYGQFLLMVFDVPLAIGLAWGNMIYAVRTFTDASSLPEWARPVLDALLVLNIDLAVDVVAIRLGMWDWGQGLQYQYFGVPFANFWAWFWVVFCFSAGLRLLRQRPGWVGRWLAPFGAMLLGLLGVMFTNALISFWIPRAFYELTVAGVLLGALALVLWLRPRLLAAPHPLAGQVALISHAYFLVAGLISGALFQPLVLLLIDALVFGMAVLVYHGRRSLARAQ